MVGLGRSVDQGGVAVLICGINQVRIAWDVSTVGGMGSGLRTRGCTVRVSKASLGGCKLGAVWGVGFSVGCRALDLEC